MSSGVEVINDVDELALLAPDAEADGYTFVSKMVAEWRDGTNRFDQQGEGCWGVRTNGRLVAVGGLNVDPYLTDLDVGRVRHLYVALANRRSGYGSRILTRIVAEAAQHFSVLRLRTFNPVAAAFYVAEGFTEVFGDEFCTHLRKTSA